MQRTSVCCLSSPGNRHSQCPETGTGSHNRNIPEQRWGVKSLADDLVASPAVVLSRAATTLRSVETKARIGRFVFSA
jgi:hypothetical protein